MSGMVCPRRGEIGAVPHNYGEEDRWTERGTCSWCGSISPEALFEAIDRGDELGPTDKNYKVYVGGQPKFYFQHLDADDQRRFIALLNDGKLNIGYPGHFYVLPFFASIRKTPTKAEE